MQEKHERTQPSTSSAVMATNQPPKPRRCTQVAFHHLHGSESLLSQNTHTKSVGSTVLCAVVIDVRDANVQDEDQ